MSRKIGIEEVKQIAIGAALLGSGGGGNPYIGKMMAISAIKEHGPVTLLSPTEVPEDSFYVSASMIGAPAVAMEKFPNGGEFKRSFDMYAQYSGKKVSGTFPVEAGGINSMMPIVAAAELGLPVIDVDGMGRAFPELQMSTFFLAGHPVTPMVLTDERGNTSLVNTVDSFWAEKIGRNITVQMGASSTSVSDGMTAKQLNESGIVNIMTFCQEIGKLIQHANSFKSIEAALNKLLEYTHGYKLLSGKITDISHVTEGGFNYGTTTIQGIDNDSDNVGKISFQNENIIMKINDRVVATAPDLIMMIDSDTLLPVTNEEARYGKRVYVIGLPADEKWRTDDGIKLVGPRYFKYDVDYVPIEERYADYVSGKDEV